MDRIAGMGVLFFLSVGSLLVVCVSLSLFILVQEGKGVGALFGADTQDSLFGLSTAHVIKKITAYLALSFFVLCCGFSVWTSLMRIKQDGANNASPSQEIVGAPFGSES